MCPVAVTMADTAPTRLDVTSPTRRTVTRYGTARVYDAIIV